MERYTKWDSISIIGRLLRPVNNGFVVEFIECRVLRGNPGHVVGIAVGMREVRGRWRSRGHGDEYKPHVGSVRLELHTVDESGVCFRIDLV